MTIKPSKWKITLSGTGRGTVECDGFPIRNVTGVTVKAEAGQLTRITLDVHNVEAEIEAEGMLVDQPDPLGAVPAPVRDPFTTDPGTNG